jgi:hypothetical protein
MRTEVIALFREVADRSPAERTDYYVRQQVPEPLRAEVESLLQYDLSSDSLGGYVASAERLLLDRPSSQAGSGPARTSTSLPDAIGRFTVTRLLGRGGMGEVYLARDPVLERPVAIKLIGTALDDEAARRRLVREARTTGRLRHPNIVTIYEAGEHESRSYIAMEYVPGETLGGIIRRRAAISLRQRLEMVEGACAGLAHAHRAGVIHLDIKPDNLMLDDAGVVKVLDFGISRVLRSETLATAHVAGTLRYMSPEQIQGKALDHRSDVFSLGCALFELVSYAPAYSGSTKEIVTQIAMGPVPSLLDASPRIDRRLDDIVGRAMALDPSERYDDLEELRTALVEVRARIDPAEDEPQASSLLGVAPASQGAVARTSRRWSRRRTAWRSRSAMAGVVGAAALAGTAAFFAWEIRKTPEAGTAPAPTAFVATAAPSEPEGTTAVEAPQTSEPGEDVWRQWARGDRAGVLARLGSTDRGRASDDMALASAVVDTVRATVLRTRETAAAAAGAAGAATYRAGEEQLARANQLAAKGQPVESLRAFWQAADLFGRSLAEPAPEITVRPKPESPMPTDPIAASRGVAAPSADVIEPPQPQPAAPAPVVSAAPERAAATNPPPPEPPSDSEAILDTLRRYDAAYESLDVAALLKVFPSLGDEQVELLRRTFDGMTSYEMDTRNIRVDVMNDSATVHATVARRMAPRVGQPVANEVDTEFRLQRTGSGWVIVGVSAR